jgi:hypothetical protein
MIFPLKKEIHENKPAKKPKLRYVNKQEALKQKGVKEGIGF